MNRWGVFQSFGTEEDREQISERYRAWSESPTLPATAEVWEAAVSETENQNVPTWDSEWHGVTSVLEYETEPDAVDVVRQFARFTRQELQTAFGESVQAFRFLGDLSVEVSDYNPKAVESWSVERDAVLDYAEFVREESGTVIEAEIPVDSVFAAYLSTPALMVSQRELVVGLPSEWCLEANLVSVETVDLE